MVSSFFSARVIQTSNFEWSCPPLGGARIHIVEKWWRFEFRWRMVVLEASHFTTIERKIVTHALELTKRINWRRKIMDRVMKNVMINFWSRNKQKQNRKIEILTVEKYWIRKKESKCTFSTLRWQVWQQLWKVRILFRYSGYTSICKDFQIFT